MQGYCLWGNLGKEEKKKEKLRRDNNKPKTEFDAASSTCPLLLALPV